MNATVGAVEIARSQEQLDVEIQKDRPTCEAIQQALDSFRSECAKFILNDFEGASKQGCEDQLWNAHLQANTHFRTAIRKLNEGGNAKIVERRKYGTEYLRFIKSSQRFYRSYVRSLHELCGGVEPLKRLADKFSGDDVLFTENSLRSQTSPPNNQVLRSCFRSLIQLGDLSRYRESELAKGKPNWAPAVGFYDLARRLVPSSGISYNQSAIITLSDGDLFRAIYWIYRAISVDEPHPQADQNLRRSFNKVVQAAENGTLQAGVSPANASLLNILSRSQLMKDTFNIAELELGFVEDLRNELRQSSSFGRLLKLFLVNFAAVQHAQDVFTKTQGAEGSFDAFIASLRLTLRSCNTLFTVVNEQFDARARRMPEVTELVMHFEGPICSTIPLWRLSLLWVLKSKILLINSIHVDLDRLQSELWKLLADCLSYAWEIVIADHIPRLECLLDEDEDTLGFTPLLCDSTERVWILRDGEPKKPLRDMDSGFSESNEIMVRLADIIDFGKVLASDEATPLQFDDEHGFHIDNAPGGLNLAEVDEQMAVDEDTAEVEAERMVNDLVDDDLPEPNEPLTPAPVTVLPRTSSTKAPSSYVVGSSTNELMSDAARRISWQRKEQSTAAPRLTATSAPRASLDSPNAKDVMSSRGSPHTPNLHPSSVRPPRSRPSHARGLSNESTGSLSSGTGLRRSALTPTSAPNSADKNDTSNALLFGAGQSAWTPSEPESKRFSGGLERIGGSPRLAPRAVVSPVRTASYGCGASAWDGTADSAGASKNPQAKFNVHAKPFK